MPPSDEIPCRICKGMAPACHECGGAGGVNANPPPPDCPKCNGSGIHPAHPHGPNCHEVPGGPV